MPVKIDWTLAEDAMLLRLRANKVTWDDIADLVGHARNTCIERARSLGELKRGVILEPMPETPALSRGPAQPKPAGHPETWTVINAGTVLAGEPYPLPVFL